MKTFVKCPQHQTDIRHHRAATAGKAPKAWALPRFWEEQPVKKHWGRILSLAWLKFVVAPLTLICIDKENSTLSL